MNSFRFALLTLVWSASALAQDKPLTIDWANTQWPPSTNHTVSATNQTANIYGQVWIDGITSQPGATPKLIAQLGFGPAGSNPLTNANWKWIGATFNLDVGNNDEFMAALLPENAGSFDYLYRYSLSGGGNWLYADLKGPVPNGETPVNPGKLTVAASDDKTPPSAPEGLVVAGTSPTEITLGWKSIMGDATLHGYEILRSASSGGPYTNLARVRTNSFKDTTVSAGKSYFYVTRSVDQSFNRSARSAEVGANAEESASVTFNVTVPPSTEATGKSVYLAGTLAVLNGAMPDWDPGILPMNRVDATHWTITLSGKEGTQLNYKYTLGSWDNVEKGKECNEITDRARELKATGSNPQSVADTVANWRNVERCKD